MLYLVSVIPIFLYFIFVKGLDGFALSSASKMLESFVWGIFCCVAGFFVGMKLSFESSWFFPMLEEVIKVFPLAVAIFRRRSAFFTETLIYGAAIGAGFSLLENVLYAYWYPDFSLGDAVLRGFGTSIIHMGCTALCGSCVLLASRFVTNSGWPLKLASSVAGMLPSVCIHVLYNLFLLPELLQMLLAIVVMGSLFILTNAFDNNKIHGWLDNCISNDITLLNDIHEGRLSGTSAGEYLIMVKERFRPEVFFDICVFLGLYLDMSIAAKSRMILKEAEMDIPIPEEEHKANLEKLRELEALEKNIGPAGIRVLKPIIGYRAADRWVMDSLL